MSFLDRLVNPEFLNPETATDFGAAGTKTIKKADKACNTEKGFYELAQGRSSSREFSGEPIDLDKVMNAIRNAERTPSVCNRQGVEGVLGRGQGVGAQGAQAPARLRATHKMPEVLLTITVSNNTYLSPVERNQAFVDGGLFAMSVMYGLEYEGLAAVPLNAMMYYKDQKAVRELLDIGDSEMISMFIAVGDFLDEFVVPISDRKPADVKRR